MHTYHYTVIVDGTVEIHLTDDQDKDVTVKLSVRGGRYLVEELLTEVLKNIP